MEYYFLTEKNKPGTAFAYTEGETPVAHDLIPELKGKTELPFRLVLKKVTPGKGSFQVSDNLSGVKHVWMDYQPNNLAWCLMSEKMKELIEKNLTGRESIVWMKVQVTGNSENRLYYIPCFEKELDVLDMEKTLFVKGTNHIIKPVFSLQKITNYHLFYKPQDFWEIPSGLYISQKIRSVLEAEKITGIAFENITVS